MHQYIPKIGEQNRLTQIDRETYSLTHSLIEMRYHPISKKEGLHWNRALLHYIVVIVRQ